MAVPKSASAMAQINYPNEPIAMVGSGFRFPGGTNTHSSLWDLLKKPRDVQSKIPKERFDVGTFYHPDGTHHGRTNAPYAYTLQEDLRVFDATFFNIQAGEVESMDPQQRLLLETVYEAVSNAGMRIQDLQGSSTAVYCGMMTHDFETTSTRDLEYIPTYSATGVAVSIASNRISYFFDWHGPSMTLDTACSSSLAAVHLAVQQLRSGESKMAIAAGANLILGPMTFVLESKLKMLSPTGRSRMWDAGADGYARGEAICSVVLKTLSQALRDGDHIECLIRETGINQDGRTTGITMPNHSAQEALIRATYAKAGLDITKPEDRCQFFEAHGTGTPAGDPQEAEAIATAFFGHQEGSQHNDAETNPLYVGSIKTVVGHTEGTAGLAGLMKASFAVQHGVIPPNLLFENLSPRVEPFYRNLKIPTEATPWPNIAPGEPRRVSVNSFGFGGTNVHAIIEEYIQNESTIPVATSLSTDSSVGVDVCCLPLVLSTKSQRSMKATLENMLRFIDEKPQINMHDLAWTLLSKRSVLPFRRAISGHNREAVRLALEAAIEDGNFETDLSTGTKSKPLTLGVFTGQGAQWPSMLKKLIVGIPFVGAIIDELDHSLQALPEKYRPSWTLREQLILEGEDSNVGHSRFSQPLCCAVQVVLVRLLTAAGIELNTIVGHSSGEIACAFAAGFISAYQAIRVAYLRGIVSAEHASSPSGQKGAMLAAGMSYYDAKELCELEAFDGRVIVAASNSPDSVTLSGDADAIEHVKGVLDDESTFSRVLRVDKAYHSHHMLPCVQPYIQALKDCGCAVADGKAGTSDAAWYSSVYEDNRRMTADLVTADYWKDNLISPVLFSYAVRQAVVVNRSIGVAVEVGCHPALKGPCLATIKDALPDTDLPYTGCLERSKNDVDAFSKALGYLWERFGISSVDADAFMKEISPERPVQNQASILPPYCWDHSRSYWTESRATREHLRGKAPHLLLGKLSTYSTTSTFQWLNFVRPRDLDWLEGHALQGQTVFPAAGYIIMAMEAAMHVASARGARIQLCEIFNMSINKAVTFEDENSMVELNLTADVTNDPAEDDDTVTLNFFIDSCLAKETELSTSAKGQLVVTFLKTPPSSLNQHPILPPPDEEHPQMNRVNINSFYRELDLMGYDYSKEFRRLKTMKRADSKANGTIELLPLNDQVRDQPLLLHPAPLDIAFQTVIGAYSSPGDRRLRSLYVPTHIDRLALVPSLCLSAVESGTKELGFNTTNTYDKGDFLSGDITVFDSNNKTLFQVENIIFKPFSPPSASTDHKMFAKWFWGPLTPEKLLDSPAYWATQQDREAIPIIERIVYFHIRSLLDQLTDEDYRKAAIHLQRQIDWCKQVVAQAQEGRHSWYHESWEEDTLVIIQNLCESNSYHPHVRLVQRVGENLLSTIRDHNNPFELMDHDGLLTDFYTNPISFGPALHYAQDLVSQIAHRFQSIDILEIGAGTGGATKYVLKTPQLGFNSYMYTDITTEFFGKAREHFAEFEDRMEFEALDIRQKPAEQGFVEHSYDLIIASNVLHATPNLEETMAHARSLLKPGGHMVILEITHREHTRLGFIFGLFADWWAGVDDGRVLEPFVSFDRWESILKKVGFSGIDSRTLDRDANLFPTSVFSTHAIDDNIVRLYQPLSAPKNLDTPLVIVGGKSTKTRHILANMRKLLPHRHIQSVDCLMDLLDSANLQKKSTFVVLSEIDEEIFASLDEDKFEAVKYLLFYANSMLWLTENAWVDHPNQASTIGMLRSIRREHPDLGVHLLDVANVDHLNTEFLVEQVLRLEEALNDELVRTCTWTDEPEVYLCKNRVWIPRLKHDMERNNRMNSARRLIHCSYNPSETPVAIKHKTDASSLSSYYLESAETFHAQDHTLRAKIMKIHVAYCLTQAIRIPRLGFLHVVQGYTLEGSSRVPVVALAQESASIVHVSRQQVYQLPQDGSYEKNSCAFLPSVAGDFISETVLRSSQYLGSFASILVLEPPSFCVEALLSMAKKHDVQVHFATTLTECNPSPLQRSGSWINLHGSDTSSHLKQILPANLVAFFDLSSDETVRGLKHRLCRVLPPNCVRYNSDYLVRKTASLHTGSYLQNNGTDISSFIKQSIARLTEGLSNPKNLTSSDITKNVNIVPATQLSSLSNQPRFDLSTIIHWNADEVSARIRPIDSEKLFMENKTYLLVGLTGDLGRSLCRWMVLHGARHVVLSSRNPRVDPKWIANVEQLGGKITILPMDVASEESVETGLVKLNDMKLPPIGGIAFGPLVLQDVMLKNMDLQMMEMVLQPKVQGARILHERFSDPASSNALDFFVMFSSIVAVMGNPGQANYSAANAYLQALAQKRCANGLAGSTIDIGAVYGVGFVTRAELEEDFNAIRFMFDSVEEHELHTLFAEAVVSGRRLVQEQGCRAQYLTAIDMSEVEITTGIPGLDPALKERITFFNDARVGNFKTPEKRGKTSNNALGSKGSVKEQLMQAKSLDEVRQIVIGKCSDPAKFTINLVLMDPTDGLSEKLHGTLQIAEGESVHPTIPLIDQGVDSLGAVTVGSWFSKQLLLDLPLLRVLGGASISDLADDAATRLPPKATPLVGRTDDSEESSDNESSGTQLDSSNSTMLSTEPSSGDEEDEDKKEVDRPLVLRREKLSLGQEYSWRLQQLVDDETIFNNTIGMFMLGPMDLNKFSRALRTSIRRHEIFRTAFIADEDNCNDTKSPLQEVLKFPNNNVQILRVTNRAAAEEGYRQIANTKYNITAGDTLRLVVFEWGKDEHLLVVGYHRLVGDGSTTENLFVEAAQLYNSAVIKPPSTQFCDLVVRQREDLNSGRLNDDIAYWESMHRNTSKSAVLPLMLPLINGDSTSSQQKQHQREPCSWLQHEAIARLDPMIAFRIKERSRKHKSTPMQFYLSAYHVLLARLTGSKDITIGIADTNRSTLDEVTAMGFFAGLLPLRFDEFAAHKTFGEHLVTTKDRVRESMQHSRIPYSVVLDRMGLGIPSSKKELALQTHAPLFQAVFDYRQGQAESGKIGGASMTEVIAFRERTPYDVVLEMSDDPTKDPLLTVKLQTSLYDRHHPQDFLDRYIALLSMFSMNPALKLA